MQFKVYGWF